MIFRHSGATGDIIFSLPTIRHMGGGKLIIYPFHEQRAKSIKKLIEIQPYITEVEISDSNDFTHDLNKFRDVFKGANDSIVEAHFRGQGITEYPEYKSGWLTLPKKDMMYLHSYSIINRTTNYADPNFDWKKEVEYLETISDEVFFIGYKEECDIFNHTFGTNVKFIDVDFLEGAYLLRDAAMFSGCYSCWSTIAQGLGINYRIEQAPNHTCSTFFIDRETIINA